MKKALRRIGCAVLAVSTIAVSAMSFTACTTKRPEVEIQISFNGEEYNLEYTLYRKYAPNTVKHFLALADAGYYDGMCIHNYVHDSKMQTGAYKYNEEFEDTGKLEYVPYFETVKNIANFPASVYTDKTGTTPTYTLYGEFRENDFSVEHGEFLTQQFGALSMYYTYKPVDSAQVEVVKVSNNKFATKDYHYNSATSRFNISLWETKDYYYCTFATLDNEEELRELVEAINEYKKTYEDGNSFTKMVELNVDEDDPYVGDKGLKETYNIPDSPIIINYVKVNKY